MAEERKKATVRKRYEEFVAHEFSQPLGQLSERQRSLGLIRLYITEIHNRVKTSISEDDVEMGLVDGSKDLGADFIHKDDNSVLIIQAKQSSKGYAVPQSDIAFF